MTRLPDEARSILDRHVVAHLATINPDGSPQLTAIWIERNGDGVRFSTAEGRVKLRNLRRFGRSHWVSMEDVPDLSGARAGCGCPRHFQSRSDLP